MNRTLVVALFATSTMLTALPAAAGPLDPDCTPEKAAKSAAAKATVGVGGRCSPAEAAKDTAKGATGDGDRKKPLSGDRDRKKNNDNDNGNNRNKNKN